VYVRQSTVAQVRFNTESTQRQYGLVSIAAELGWLAEQIGVVDADLGVSGRFGAERKLTHARVLQALKNPTHAGAYTFGKTRDVRRVQPDGSVRSVRRKRAGYRAGRSAGLAGHRWHTGATDEPAVARPGPGRTPHAALEVIRRHGATHTSAELADMLNAAGLTTGKGKPFTAGGVARVRDAYKIFGPRTGAVQSGEVSVKQAAAELGIPADAVYN